MKESTLEKKASKLAREHGWWTAKFSSPSHRGVPDRIFIKGGEVLFVEFKAEGKKASKLQRVTAVDMEEHGAEVYVVDNMDSFRGVLMLPQEFSDA